MAKKGKLTPMMIQYYSNKEKHKDAILLFRMGDFYETFDEDAKTVSEELDLVLTARQGQSMAGIPYHALDNYLGKLVRKGYKVAICEQVEDPKKAKGLVKREVTRVVTPGTIMEDVLLDDKANNYLAAVYRGKGDGGHMNYGLAAADVSTGQFFATEFDSHQELVSEMARIRPAECILPREMVQDRRLTEACGSVEVDDSEWSPEAGAEALRVHFGTRTLEPFGCQDKPLATTAAGMVLGYIKGNNMGEAHLTSFRAYTPRGFMALDASTLRNLEICYNIRDGGTDGTLLEVLDRTVTPMGGRLLRRWLLQPLLDIDGIRSRHGAVERISEDLILMEEMKEVMKGFHDMERLMSKVMYGSANPRDIMAIRNSLRLVGNLKRILERGMDRDGETEGTGYEGVGPEEPGEREEEPGEAGAGHPADDDRLLSTLTGELDELGDVVGTIDDALVEDPPTSIKDGGIITRGYSERLDELNDGVGDAREWIEGLEAREKVRTGIKTLKLGFNKVFGYYIEVSKGQADRVPDDYMRKQTLVNSERFITEELKRYEEIVLSADEKIKALEQELFEEIRDRVGDHRDDIMAVARAVAQIDVLRGLAQVAVNNDYVRPRMSEETGLVIEEGRHPVIERTMRTGEFVPNDTGLDCDRTQLMILTGPNMAGKSTYMRQVALITILAQMGSFVPAREAEIGLVDKVFTRVGASDDLTRGQSTFMVEMVETATILHTSTRRSLILLDEIGRGTATFDGLSLAWAVAEHLHNNPRLGGKTIFATHYHQLTELTRVLPRAKNYHMPVREQDDELVFLRKVGPGSVDKSYGIQVAKLAGLPNPVIERAKEVLGSLEAEELMVLEEREPGDRAGTPLGAGGPSGTGEASGNRGRKRIKVKGPPRPKVVQTTLFPQTDEVREEIESMDLGNMTPLEALNILGELQDRIRRARDDHERDRRIGPGDR